MDARAEDSNGTADATLDKPVKGLSESGSLAVEERISSLLEKAGLDIENLEDEQQVRKVCSGI